MKYFLVGLLIFFAVPGAGQSMRLSFKVDFKGNSIGTLEAVLEQTGNTIRKDIKSNTDTRILVMAIHVESEIEAVDEDGVLLQGTAYRHSNRGTEDVHSQVKKIGTNSYQVERNNVITMLENQLIDFSVADLYFKEPVSKSLIFSNMYGQFLPIKRLGPGKYEVVSPDKNASTYTYLDGKLSSVEVELELGKLILTRM
jgi:hypothetical protein